MIEDIFTFLSNSLYENFFISVFASFSWGVLSILLSPCHLSSIPLIIGYINSYGEISIKKTFYVSLVFSFGILITIALIGIITALMGRLIGDVGTAGNYIVAVVFFVVGLYLLDLIKLPWSGNIIKGTSQKGLLAALILGLLFGIGLGPCTFAFMAPVLGVVFEVSQENIFSGTIILLAFGIGHCFVITGAGTLTRSVQSYLHWTENSNITLWIKRICGILVILGGFYLISIAN